MTVIDRVASFLDRRTSRRGFLVKTTLVGSALAVSPVEFLLKPTTAYAAICRCGNPGCRCGSACCDGYTEFCCSLFGANVCPSGSFAGGWWKADGSAYCAGPRYYIDCHAECSCGDGCRPGGQSFCSPGCDGLNCGCAGGNCNNRLTGCVSFRYGQCHQEIACAGRILCRVVSCTPAYLLDNACSTTAMTDNNTAQHNAPCLQAPAFVGRAYAVTARGGAALVAGRDGGVFCFGGANFLGSTGGQRLNQPVVGIAPTPGDDGYWLVARDGGVFCFGRAGFFGSTGGIPLDAPIVGMAPTPNGQGYWLVASDGGVFCFGNASFYGSTGGKPLTSPIVAITVAHDGTGYWLLASDGGVFAFGSANYFGSLGGAANNTLAAGLVTTPTQAGYWIWEQNGEVHPFGDAPALSDWHAAAAAGTAPPLAAGGVDAFFALDVAGDASTHTLWAISQFGPPPLARAFSLTPM